MVLVGLIGRVGYVVLENVCHFQFPEYGVSLAIIMTIATFVWWISHYKSTKNRKSIKYPSIASSIAPVPHDKDLPVTYAWDLYTPEATSNSISSGDRDEKWVRVKQKTPSSPFKSNNYTNQ